MSYMDIDNLYKNQDILLFKECWAMEKIHGTSAHIQWADGQLHFFAGGSKHEAFIALFDASALSASFIALGLKTIIVYGEAYGGKLQGMSKTYGDKLRFVVFEIKIGDSWLCVPDAQELATKLGFEFVDFARISTDLEAIDKEMMKPSTQAIRNGMGEGLKREGIVLRPLLELRKNNGERIIAKYKNPEFAEVKTPRPIDQNKLTMLANAQAIADEWVTEMRLAHILDAFPDADIKQTGNIIKTMIADIQKESIGEIEWTPAASTAIGRKTALLFKGRLVASLIKTDGR